MSICDPSQIAYTFRSALENHEKFEDLLEKMRSITPGRFLDSECTVPNPHHKEDLIKNEEMNSILQFEMDKSTVTDEEIKKIKEEYRVDEEYNKRIEAIASQIYAGFPFSILANIESVRDYNTSRMENWADLAIKAADVFIKTLEKSRKS